MVKTPIPEALIAELKASHGLFLELPTKDELDEGLTLSQVAFRAGYKACIDYLSMCCELQRTSDNDITIEMG